MSSTKQSLGWPRQEMQNLILCCFFLFSIEIPGIKSSHVREDAAAFLFCPKILRQKRPEAGKMWVYEWYGRKLWENWWRSCGRLKWFTNNSPPGWKKKATRITILVLLHCLLILDYFGGPSELPKQINIKKVFLNISNSAPMRVIASFE